MKLSKLYQCTFAIAAMFVAAPAFAQDATTTVSNDWPTWIGRVHAAQYVFFSDGSSSSAMSTINSNEPSIALEVAQDTAYMPRQEMYYYSINNVVAPNIPNEYRGINYANIQRTSVMPSMLPPVIVQTGSRQPEYGWWPDWIGEPMWMFNVQ